MKFTDIFIRRPVLAVSISLLMIILGCKQSRNWQCVNTLK